MQIVKIIGTLIVIALSTVYAYSETAIIGTIWKQINNTAHIADDIEEVNFFDIPNWNTEVARTTLETGIHTHAPAGDNSCQATINSIDNTKIDIAPCVHHTLGFEFNIDAQIAVDPQFLVDESAIFLGYSQATLIRRDDAFTTAERRTRIPIARIQAKKGQFGPGSEISELGVSDIRQITSEFASRDNTWVKQMIGPLVRTGLETTENVTTDRHVDITAGIFSDEEKVIHETIAFNAISGLTLFHTALGNWTTVLGIIRPDNINYDNGFGRVPLQNNNRYASHDLFMSQESNGRDPRFFLLYSQAEYADAGAAAAAAFDFGPFVESDPRVLPLAKIIIKKNDANFFNIIDARPFIGNVVGSSLTAATLQTAYNNSPDAGMAEITTGATNGALTIAQGGDGVSDKILETEHLDGNDILSVYTTHINIAFNNVSSAMFDNNTTSGNTRFLLYNVDNGLMERVSVGVVDSGGSGFKVLRMPN